MKINRFKIGTKQIFKAVRNKGCSSFSQTFCYHLEILHSLDYFIKEFWDEFQKRIQSDKRWFRTDELSLYTAYKYGVGIEREELNGYVSALKMLKGISPINKMPIENIGDNQPKWVINQEYYEKCYRGPPTFYKPLPYKIPKALQETEYYKTCFKDPPTFE